MVNLKKSTDRPAVTLVKRTGRHASANELRPTIGGDYVPRHGRRYALFTRKVLGGHVFIINI